MTSDHSPYGSEYERFCVEDYEPLSIDMGDRDSPNEDQYEDLEYYAPGGWHPVHLGDRLDDARYTIKHKLGFGNSATVWLARDTREQKWVSLKIVRATLSAAAYTRSERWCEAMRHSASPDLVLIPYRHFLFDGPNGRHLCIVSPVVGPSLAQLSNGFESRLTPRFARKIAHQAVKTLAEIHSGRLRVQKAEVTAECLLLNVATNIEEYSEDEIYRATAWPSEWPLWHNPYKSPGAGAPRYVVQSLNFFDYMGFSKSNIKLTFSSQHFAELLNPDKGLATYGPWLAPEVVVGGSSTPASDVWSLGCCIYRLRAGDVPFEHPYEVGCPRDLLSYMAERLGTELPDHWRDDTRWDDEGWPTKHEENGMPHAHDAHRWSVSQRCLRAIVDQVWDEPPSRTITSNNGRTSRNDWRIESQARDWKAHTPFPQHVADIVWNPQAVKINDYFVDVDDTWDQIDNALLPRMPAHEAALLHDLLSKVFVMEPSQRITAAQMLDHPWFHLDHGAEEPGVGYPEVTGYPPRYGPPPGRPPPHSGSCTVPRG